jgi:hypothetical protein
MMTRNSFAKGALNWLESEFPNSCRNLWWCKNSLHGHSCNSAVGSRCEKQLSSNLWLVGATGVYHYIQSLCTCGRQEPPTTLGVLKGQNTSTQTRPTAHCSKPWGTNFWHITAISSDLVQMVPTSKQFRQWITP